RDSLISFNKRKAGKDGSDLKDESCGLVGSEFLAEVTDWSVITSESDSKDPVGNADSNKMLTTLVSAMGECAFSIVREPEPQYFDEDFLHDFCISTLKIISCLVEDVIASLWISPPELKQLFASFHETSVALHNIKHFKNVVYRSAKFSFYYKVFAALYIFTILMVVLCRFPWRSNYVLEQCGIVLDSSV
ncbi:hypothetical protein HID58_016910, partial [Brassica napus]